MTPFYGRPLAQRLALGAACGAAAFVLNSVPLPMLSAESPEFAFGGIFVLFAFRQLGPAAGVLAAVLGYYSAGTVIEASIAATIVYAIEGAVVSRIALRTRSLVVADVMFWLTGGALLDSLVYVAWIGLSPAYVLLLVVKQLLNGVMNAVVAEWASRRDRVRAVLRLPPEPPSAWQEVLFDRTVPLVMVPMTIIVLLLARASHAAYLNRTTAELRQTATNAEKGADQFFQSRLASLDELRLSLHPSGTAIPGDLDRILNTFLLSHPEFVNVFVTDAHGIVVAAAPRTSATGVENHGRDLSRRPYFSAARASRRAVFGELVLGQLQVRRLGVEPILPLAVPIFTARGDFAGVVMGALDAATLPAILSARAASRDGAAQLLDRAGRVVASSRLAWAPGDQRAPELGDLLKGSGDAARPIVPAGPPTYATRLAVAPRLTITQALSIFPFVVLADEPLTMVHQAMVPTSLALVALMLVALLAVYAVARTLGAQMAAPLQSIREVSEDLASGRSVPHEVLDRFGASPVQEVRTLAAHLLRMDDALRERREADAQAVADSETKYRETLEQLVQAQKMEGIGRLAGGIAHDFNNLLTPIVGYTDLAMAGVPEGNPARKDLTLVRTAAGRAKEVVAQLLAFGRAQVLDTKRIDLADVVAEFEPLLRRSLSANYDLQVIAEPGIVVDADRAKVQQVLMNLVINAADAMPGGGRVEVRVGVEELRRPSLSDPEPLRAGSYGVICVRDSGVGMDEETRRRAFEPFFTTKPRGKGTGLGLSTAYGIVRQHRGTIVMESVVGTGTSMRVLLPVAAPAPYQPHSLAETPELPAPAVVIPTDQAATVLIVEDEDAVRELVRVALARAGYRVLVARDGDEALTRAAAHDGRIDLLLTDVVMPGLNGREVAQRVRQVRPDSRVLFMSGYAAEVIAEGGALSGDAPLLVKPFTPDELHERVREAMGR